MLILDHTAPRKRTPARNSTLLATACAAAPLTATSAMAPQLETGPDGTPLTNITTAGPGKPTIGRTTRHPAASQR